MSFRFRTLAISSLLFAAACAADPPTDDPGDDPGGPANPGEPGPGRAQTPTEQIATGLGVSVVSSDVHGAPCLIRSILPRAGTPGMTADVAARDHVAALASLWVSQGQPASLVSNGIQQLRNGASVVKLSQRIDGVLVDQGELRVMLHADGALAAVSGTLLASPSKASFASNAHQALERALDQQYGASRPQLAVSDGGSSGDWQVLQVGSAPQLTIENARGRPV